MPEPSQIQLRYFCYLHIPLNRISPFSMGEEQLGSIKLTLVKVILLKLAFLEIQIQKFLFYLQGQGVSFRIVFLFFF